LWLFPLIFKKQKKFTREGNELIVIKSLFYEFVEQKGSDFNLTLFKLQIKRQTKVERKTFFIT
jgi:hypothetical protein